MAGQCSKSLIKTTQMHHVISHPLNVASMPGLQLILISQIIFLPVPGGGAIDLDTDAGLG